MKKVTTKSVHCRWCGRTEHIEALSRPVGWEEIGNRLYCGSCVKKLMGKEAAVS